MSALAVVPLPFPAPRLTPREQQVVVLICDGHSTKEVAYRLEIATKTAESHRTNAMEKLDLHSVALLVRWAIRTGLVIA